MRVRGFWMEGNLDVLEHGDYMKKFVWGEIEPFHCGMVGNFGIWCFTEMWIIWKILQMVLGWCISHAHTKQMTKEIVSCLDNPLSLLDQRNILSIMQIWKRVLRFLLLIHANCVITWCAVTTMLIEVRLSLELRDLADSHQPIQSSLRHMAES